MLPNGTGWLSRDELYHCIKDKLADETPFILTLQVFSSLFPAKKILPDVVEVNQMKYRVLSNKFSLITEGAKEEYLRLFDKYNELHRYIKVDEPFLLMHALCKQEKLEKLEAQMIIDSIDYEK